jgi:hypothetical protein
MPLEVYKALIEAGREGRLPDERLLRLAAREFADLEDLLEHIDPQRVKSTARTRRTDQRLASPKDGPGAAWVCRKLV